MTQDLSQQVEHLRQTNRELRETRAKLQRLREQEQILTRLLRLAVTGSGPTAAQLERALECILSLTAFADVPGAAVLLADGERLERTAGRGLQPEVWQVCPDWRTGHCRGGERSADTGVRFVGAASTPGGCRLPHPHYCAPIQAGDKTLGVLVVMVPGDRPEEREDGDYVAAAAGALASLIEAVRSREALRRERDFSATVVEASPAAVAAFDNHRRIFMINRTVATGLGWERGAVGEEFVETMIAPPAREAMARCLEKSIASRSPGVLEAATLTGRGERRLVEWHLQPVFTPSETLDYCFAVGVDRTEHHRVDRQTRQSQKLEAIGTLAAGISHDFNNMLQAIIGYTEVARHAIGPEARARRALDRVLASAHRATALVRQILTFSRQTEQARRRLLLGPIVKEAAKLLRASAPSTIDFQQYIAADCPEVMADQSQMYQVVVNLFANACQAMEKHGGTLQVVLESVQIGPGDPPPLAPGRYVRFRVCDNGPGMLPAVRERIFEPYFTTRAAGKGAGLGMAMVHGIVTDHGGAIGVESEPDAGTAVTVWLPSCDAEESSLKGFDHAPPSGTERILFVDDEAPLAELAVDGLEMLGYQVSAYTESTRAIAELEANPDRYDLVVTDLTMPEVSGLAVAEACQRICPTAPVVLCSGYAEGIDGAEAATRGIAVVIHKPVGPHELAATIRRLLDAPASIPTDSSRPAAPAPTPRTPSE